MVWRKGCEFTVLRVTTASRRHSNVNQAPPLTDGGLNGITRAHLSHCMMKTIATRQRPCRPHVDRHVLLPWKCSRAALLFFHAIFRGRLSIKSLVCRFVFAREVCNDLRGAPQRPCPNSCQPCVVCCARFVRNDVNSTFLIISRCFSCVADFA